MCVVARGAIEVRRLHALSIQGSECSNSLASEVPRAFLPSNQNLRMTTPAAPQSRIRLCLFVLVCCNTFLQVCLQCSLQICTPQNSTHRLPEVRPILVARERVEISWDGV